MNELIPVSDIERMARAISASQLFGLKTPEQAMALMLVAQAEGKHPAIAARDYHIIQGRPSLKADAMLARFLDAGGRVEWHALSNEKAEATFSHPQGGSVRLSWTMDDARRAGLAEKENWKKYQRALLRSRLVSEGVRTVYPGVVCGTYTPEETEEFRPERNMGTAEVVSIDDRIETGIRELGLDRARVLAWIEKVFRGGPIPETSVERVIAQMQKWAADITEEKAEREAIQDE